MYFQKGAKSTSFTLLELLITIVVIGILAGLLLPALGRAREEARKAKCLSNLRNIYLALSLYADDHANLYPFATGNIAWDAVDPTYGTYGWMQQLFSYIKNKKVYICPSVSGTQYGYFLGTRAAYKETGKAASVNRAKIKYPSLFVLGGCTTYPFDESDCDKDDYSQDCIGWPTHGEGSNVLFADGHCRWHKGYEPDRMTFRYKEISPW